MKRTFKIVIWVVVILFILFVGADLLLSDFGPGESERDRLVVIGVYLLASGTALYYLKKKLR